MTVQRRLLVGRIWTAPALALLLLAIAFPYAHALGEGGHRDHRPCELCLIIAAGALLVPAATVLAVAMAVVASLLVPTLPGYRPCILTFPAPRGPPSW
jgi:hypothetical protein